MNALKLLLELLLLGAPHPRSPLGAVTSCNHFTREVGASGGQRESPPQCPLLAVAGCIHPMQPVAGNDIEPFHWNAELLKYAPATPAVDSSLRILTADRFRQLHKLGKPSLEVAPTTLRLVLLIFVAPRSGLLFHGGAGTDFLGFAFTFGRKRNVFLP